MQGMKTLETRAYAKINLALDVKGRRADGYHDVVTVMARISLCDTLRLTWEALPGTPDSLTVTLTTDRPDLPTDAGNLARRAATHLYERYAPGIPPGHLTMHIDKAIPVAAGLAGGSSDAAAVLTALNVLWALGLDTRTLCDLGADLGSDVPFCVLTQQTDCRFAIGRGRGEMLEPLSCHPPLFLTLAKPPFGVSTEEVFTHIDDCDISVRPDIAALTEALQRGDSCGACAHMCNVLETYTLPHYPAVGELKRVMREKTPARQVLMSGSGPTVFAVYETEQEAQQACRALRAMHYEAYEATTD